MSLPVCSKCRRISILSPCRACASPEQLKKYPPEPDDYEKRASVFVGARKEERGHENLETEVS